MKKSDLSDTVQILIASTKKPSGKRYLPEACARRVHVLQNVPRNPLGAIERLRSFSLSFGASSLALPRKSSDLSIEIEASVREAFKEWAHQLRRLVRAATTTRLELVAGWRPTRLGVFFHTDVTFAGLSSAT